MIWVGMLRGCAVSVVLAMRHLDASVFYCTSRQVHSRYEAVLYCIGAALQFCARICVSVAAAVTWANLSHLAVCVLRTTI